MRQFHIKTWYHTEEDHDSIKAVIERGDGWEDLNLSVDSPGFIIFAFAILKCELFNFYRNLNNEKIPYHDVRAEMTLNTTDDWHIEKSVIECIVYVESEDHLTDEMRHNLFERVKGCPVNRNLIHEDLIELKLSYRYVT